MDGVENNLFSFYIFCYYEVCKYYFIDEYSIVFDVMLIGINIWECLIV